MATYEYACENQNCLKTWELEQPMSEDPIKICSFCNQETAKRLISKSNFVLIGGNWAREGYSSK